MLARYLEEGGVPTTQISLIREHTETIRPPRALWVPFPLGRPLGAPDDARFQRRVLLAVLGLLEAPDGPVLADFPEEEPIATAEKAGETGAPDGPVRLSPAAGEDGAPEDAAAAFRREVEELRFWFDQSLLRRGRTAIGHFDPSAASDLLIRYLSGETFDPGERALSLPVALRLAAQDLQAFYFEAVAARPGSPPPEGAAFDRWFWQETQAGRILRAVRERCLEENDAELRQTGGANIVPRTWL